MARGSPIPSTPFGRSRLTPILVALVLGAVIMPISVGISRLEIARTYELESFDWRLRWTGRALDPSDVVVVRLDQETLARYPESGWPIPRREYATFINGVMDAGARAVALDLLFVFPDKNGIENDRALAAALGTHGERVVLGMTFAIDRSDNPELIWGNPGEGVIPYLACDAYRALEALSAPSRAGHLTVVPDLDGVTRRVPLLIECDGQQTLPLCLAAVMAFHGIPEDEIEITGSEIRVGEGPSGLRIPVDVRGCLIPSSLYRGRELGPRYSFAELMDLILDGKQELGGESLESAVGGKIVLVGMGDIVEDKKATPWSANTEGVDIHAAFIESLLNQRAARDVSFSAEVLGVYLLAATLTLFALVLPLSRGLAVWLASIIGYLAFTVVTLSFWGFILPVVSPTVGMILASAPIFYRRVISGEQWRATEERELEKARAIQRMLLPRSRPLLENVDLYGQLEECLEVAGDSYDYFLLGEGRLGISVGDVAGKGLPAAMLMSNIQGRLKAEARYLESPAAVMTAVNRACAADFEPGSYATLVYGVFRAEEKELTVCSAGHPPPLVVRADGSIRWLHAGGLPIGMLDSASYEEEIVQLGPGDAVTFYTDGITEARGPTRLFFEEKGLADALRQSAGLDAESMTKAVLRQVEDFTLEEPVSDDRTILVLKVLPDAGRTPARPSPTTSAPRPRSSG